MIRIRVGSLLLALSLFVATPATLAQAPRASLTDIENDVMCVSCREPLALAQSPQAYAERSFISQLIARGLTKHQIESALVAQYGPAVLGKPPARGFNLVVYILPPALLIAVLITLALTVPRWRRRGAGEQPPGDANMPIKATGTDASRLEEELARFKG